MSILSSLRLRDATSVLNNDISIEELVVSRLYRSYLSELGISFAELLIIGGLVDGVPRSVAELASELRFGEHVLTTHLDALKQADLICFENATTLSVRLTQRALELGSALLVMQANVDLDFGVATESITRMRNALVALARRTRQSAHG